ncbi:MAG: SpvB/TcaC N-terminal domain-containing protein, partial [Pseudomonadota bacterium]|nr:SpvB/TcaC N-terminal domain-containing protein [Pseudomonadota bacterium]
MANTESDAQSRDSESQQHIQHPTINLPKGGGAIRGMGEKFQANAVTGSGSFSIPLPLSSGRGDFTPQLSLSYNSGSGNSAFGLGWTIDVPAIRRKTDKTLPRYAEDSDTFILSGAEDLVPVLEQKGNDWQKVEQVIEEAGIQYHVTRYRPRIEGLFARIEKWQADFDIHWRAITKDNVTSIYGQTSEARIADNEHPRRIFAWLLEKSYDAKGNRIVYEYQAENNDNIENRLSEWQRLKFGFAFQQKYLKRVKYTPFVNQPERYHLQLVFDYGEHTSNTVEAVTPWPVRSDPFSEYKAGFEIRTYRLCQRILMFHNFPAEGEADHWVLVKATELTYESHPHLTYLTQVTQRGYHGETHKALPPLTFTYSRPEIATTLQQVDEASRAHLPMGLDQAQYQWIDLEGEGLSGVLSQHAGQLYYQNNAGDGRLGSMRALTQQPLTLGNLQVSDINNDGVQELVLRGDSLNGYFEYQEGHWENFVPFEQQLTFDLTDPNIKLLDLTGDGLADVLITEGEVFTWYQSQGQKGFSTGGRFFAGSEEEAGPRIVFADSSQSIFLSDMSGDGLTDIVRIRNGEVCYWPNLGYGRFGRKVDMENAPRFTVNPEDFNPRNIQLGDLDGSGTTDIFYVGNGQIEYWLNQAGNRFSAKQLIDFPLPFDSLTALSLIDFTGNGTLSLVWSTRRPGMETHQLSYLPLFNSKPHLLIEVDNHLGHLTHLQYAASTRYYLADKQAGTPWVTKLPFPVQVLAQVEHLDLVAGGRLVTEYTYHHGYYDAYEREFRGFGRVDVLDTESFADSSAEPQHYVRPILTKSWYHNGAYVTADKISKQYEQEYYAGDAQAFLLADTIIEEALDGQNLREAYRALKGSALRQEIYELGNSIPYQITEANFKVKR